MYVPKTPGLNKASNHPASLSLATLIQRANP
jgi:hypothetical protein